MENEFHLCLLNQICGSGAFWREFINCLETVERGVRFSSIWLCPRLSFNGNGISCLLQLNILRQLITDLLFWAAFE